MRPGQETGVLEHAGDDAGSDPLLLREPEDGRLAARRCRDETVPFGAGDEGVREGLIKLLGYAG